MKVLTLNTHSWMEEDPELKLRQIVDYIAKEDFEIIALQEINQTMEAKEIADELFISLKTVKTHVSNILSKLQVSDRTQATIYAYQHDLIEEQES